MSWLSQGISDDPHLESRTMGKGWGWECCLLVCLCVFYRAFPVDLVTCVAQLSKGRQWKEIIAVIQPYFPRNWGKSNHCHKLFHGFAFLKSSSLWDSNSIPENNIKKKKFWSNIALWWQLSLFHWDLWILFTKLLPYFEHMKAVKDMQSIWPSQFKDV